MLERRVRGSREATYGKHVFLVPCSSERVFARASLAIPEFYKYGFLLDFRITSSDLRITSPDFLLGKSCSSVDSEEFEPEALVDSEVVHRQGNSEVKTGMEKSLENDRLRNELKVADEQCKKSVELLKAKSEVEELTGRLSRLEAKMQSGEVSNCMEKAKFRMRLRGTQAKSNAFRIRYEEVVKELDVMNRKFEEASTKLKAQLASYALEVLNLKKQLAAVRSQ
ncbi:hypothetical protein HYC85_029758 [Camellia sinensis]|uniref:Uncharacterized protein n=1 Tax=Camellia sinensis TaxID=4442 RepID=A0A7J7FZH9_CAMSI|nr:hypothetical protein HYC85_029758 [Camellia sinensis]